MAWVETRITRTSQPQDACGIDWNNPLTEGLVRFANAAYASAGTLVDSANPRVTYTSLTPALNANTGGKSVAKNSTVLWLGSSSEGQSAIGTGDATFVFGGIDGSNNTTQYFCQIGGTSNASGNVFVGDRTGNVSALNVFGGALAVSPIAGHIAGRLETTVIVRRSGVCYFWVNGSYLGSANNASSFGNYPFSIGSVAGGNQKEVNFGGLYTAALSDNLAKSLSENPWQIFEPEIVRIWVDDYVSTGGGATTVSSDASSDYAIRAAITSDAAASYPVRAATSSDTTAAYPLRAATQSDTTAAYAIRSAASADALASYYVLGLVQSDTAGSYAVRAAAQSDALASYAVRSAVQSDALASYEILSAGVVVSNSPASYVIRAAVQANATASYPVRSVAQADASGAYAVRSAVWADVGASYAVQGALVAVWADATASYFVDGVAASGIYPSPANVLLGVQYGPSGAEYTGTLVFATPGDIAAAVLVSLNPTTIATAVWSHEQ